MEKDPNFNPRELLKKLKQRTRERVKYEWRVQVHQPVEDILDMIQHRHDPEYQARPREPYTVSANFDSLVDAKQYAYMATLKGKRCSIMNNWTGDEYTDGV